MEVRYPGMFTCNNMCPKTSPSVNVLASGTPRTEILATQKHPFQKSDDPGHESVNGK